MSANRKLGKLPPRRLMSTPSFGDFLARRSDWPDVAPRGWEYALPATGLDILGNDTWGDCAEAGAMHLIQVQTANAGVPLHGTLEQTLDLYSAVTGFDPKDASTDQGTELLSLLQYWKNVGIKVTTAGGLVVTHHILGWASLDISSVPQMRYASDLFGGTYLGVNLPESAEDDTSNWTVNPANSKIVGGHCITGVGQGSAGGHLISWGVLIPFTWNFMHQFLDEAYVVVSPEWLRANGQSPSGLDLPGLLNAMKEL